MPDLDAAAGFLAAHARVLDRRRFERLFADGPATPVRDAVAAYRNADGGLGHALEPDGRSPASQPAAVEHGLRVLHEADAWDAQLAANACDWLQATAPATGGAVAVAPSIVGWPHAPWWEPRPGLPPSLITTGQIAGTLHARGVEHPWLERATEWLWTQVEAPRDDLGAYDLRGVVRFLDHAPDRDRAADALEHARRVMVARNLVALDPDATGEVHRPLDYAPEPGSLSRELFDAGAVAANLDLLAAGQRDDGGWMFNWLAWSPAAEAEWRGSLTVDALRVLRANGR